MKYLLTCSAGVESLAKKEIMKQGGNIVEVKDRLVFFEGDTELMIKMNIWSRVGNKVYMVLNEGKTSDFNAFYDMVFGIHWKKYIDENHPVLVKATSIKSILSSTPALQKLAKKAVVDKLTNKSGDFLREDSQLFGYEVLCFLIEDNAYILLNTSGETLYKRGYRVESGEAPIKESLASAMVLLSNWKFSEPLYDITCGSGTIAIEAALIAKNIAPGIQRNFAFENWSFIPKDILPKIKKEAQEKVFEKNHCIIATDKDEQILKIAYENAKRAGVEKSIQFEAKNVDAYKKEELSGMLISNPPYGLRLKDEKLSLLYKNFGSILEKNIELKGGIITSNFDFEKMVSLKNFKKRKLYNGNEMCYFYTKNNG